MEDLNGEIMGDVQHVNVKLNTTDNKHGISPSCFTIFIRPSCYEKCFDRHTCIRLKQKKNNVFVYICIFFNNI